MELMLKQIRETRGVSQKEMAQRLSDLMGKEIKVRTYGSWERQEVGMDLEQAYNCAVALGCTLNDLVGMDSNGRPLSKDEDYLVDTYRAVTVHGKKAMLINTSAVEANYMPKSDTAEVSEVRSA